MVIVLRIVLGIAHVISGGGLQVQARGRDSGVPEKIHGDAEERATGVGECAAFQSLLQVRGEYVDSTGGGGEGVAQRGCGRILIA